MSGFTEIEYSTYNNFYEAWEHHKIRIGLRKNLTLLGAKRILSKELKIPWKELSIISIENWIFE